MNSNDAWSLVGLAVSSAGLAAYWVASTLSNRWVVRREREVLERSFGRPVRTDDDTSLSTWMKVPDAALEKLTHDLDRNPYAGAVDAAAELAMRGDSQLKANPYEENRLNLNVRDSVEPKPGSARNPSDD